MAHRNLDELAASVDHAPPVHPVRSLIDNHFYLDGYVSSETGMALLLMDALFLIPCIVALLFYPVPALIAIGALLLVSAIVWEGMVLWRRHARRHV